jgi:hypothetical protein
MLLEEALGSNKRLNNMCQAFQMMLAYWVWIKKRKVLGLWRCRIA